MPWQAADSHTLRILEIYNKELKEMWATAAMAEW